MVRACYLSFTWAPPDRSLRKPALHARRPHPDPGRMRGTFTPLVRVKVPFMPPGFE
jgi:hypothetical protein